MRCNLYIPEAVINITYKGKLALDTHLKAEKHLKAVQGPGRSNPLTNMMRNKESDELKAAAGEPLHIILYSITSASNQQIALINSSKHYSEIRKWRSRFHVEELRPLQ